MSDNSSENPDTKSDQNQPATPAAPQAPVQVPPELAIPIPEIPEEEDLLAAPTRNRPGKKERERLRAEKQKRQGNDFARHGESPKARLQDLFRSDAPANENAPAFRPSRDERPPRPTKPTFQGRRLPPVFVPPPVDADRPQGTRAKLDELFRSDAEPVQASPAQVPPPVSVAKPAPKPLESVIVPETLPSPTGRVLKAAFPFAKATIPPPQPKRRGRPPRNPLLTTEPAVPAVPKRRGRPPKNRDGIAPVSGESQSPEGAQSDRRTTSKVASSPEISYRASANGIPDDHGSSLHASGTQIVPIGEILPETLHVLPIGQRPIMPGITIPLVFSGEVFQNAIRHIWESDHKTLAVTWSPNINPENVFASELSSVGTAMRMVKVMVNDDSVQILARAIQRIERIEEVSHEPLLVWRVAYLRDTGIASSEELKAYTLSIIAAVKDLLKLSPLFQEQLKMLLNHLDFEKPGLLMDLIAAMTTAQPARLQQVLEAQELQVRGKLVLQLLKEELDVLQLQQQIKSQIDDKISQHQKEFFLKEQLKVIKKELGIEKDDKSADIEAFRAKIEKLQMSKEARKVAEEELGKLSILESASAEYHVTRTYLAWLTDLPWGITTPDLLELDRAKEILDASHHGLDDVKDRILEYIATLRKRGSLTGSILCLVGAPGVGKTSVARSIADALGRNFYRFSVGGMRDEAEIKGHRRTYVGAMPGKLIQSLKRTASTNPVILLDEIDKITTSYHGDPAAALLEVLDPEQNREFLDHYLDVRVDLSGVLFITTANSLDTIPAALLDRMEVIKLSGYVLEEKVAIARDHLLPHQLKEHGLKPRDLKIHDKILAYLVENYAREAGVRTLEKTIKRICRKVARQHAEGETAIVNLAVEQVQSYLGLPLFSGEELYNSGVAGTALGLAWTSMGGATLYMEAIGLQSEKGGFQHTGQLGDVMGESARIAYSYARKIVEDVEPAAAEYFRQHQIHLHIPAGATPKDGPSAGITMALALYSLATGKAIKAPLAMTGELTLSGKVLPIGGVREKIIAAKRVKVFEVILPADNRRDFDKLPEYIRNGMKVHYADRFADVLVVAYGGAAKIVAHKAPKVKVPGTRPVGRPRKEVALEAPKPSQTQRSSQSGAAKSAKVAKPAKPVKVAGVRGRKPRK